MSDGCYSVYIHTNTLNGKVYVGMTSMAPEDRWANGRGYRSCRHFERAINKYGWDKFDHAVIKDNLTLEEANTLERELIKKYLSNNPKYGYNITDGGSNGKHSEETKRLLSKIKTGCKVSEETKRKISEALSGENGYWYGKIRSDETRKKISNAKKGIPVPEELKRRISEKLKGEGCYWYGKHLSEEHKQKLRERNLGKVTPPEVKEKIAKSLLNKNGSPVSQYSFDGKLINTYPSIAEAARCVDGDTSTIFKCCKEKYGRNFAYNSQWRLSSDNIKELPPIPKRVVLQKDKNGNLLKEWDSPSQIVKSLGISKYALSACLNGKSKTSSGFVWEYKYIN